MVTIDDAKLYRNVRVSILGTRPASAKEQSDYIMKNGQLIAVIAALVLVVGVTLVQAGGGWTGGLPLLGCRSALGDREALLRLTVGTFGQPCATFHEREVPGDEFYNRIQLNRFGLHDDPTTLRKPANTWRILLVGDDMTQAIQVEQAQTFAALVEADLNATAAQQIEIINLSHAGYGTDRELMLYAVLGAAFDADVVILVVNLTDDVLQNNILLDQHRLAEPPSRPYFTLWRGDLTLHNSADLDPYLSAAPAYEWLITMQQNQAEPVRERPPEHPRRLHDEPPVLQYPVELGLYLPDDSYWAHGWQVTDELIRAFRDLAEQGGARFGVVILPDKRMVQDADWRATVNRYPVVRAADPLAPSQRLEDRLEAAGIAHTNLTWTMRSSRLDVETEDGRLYYFWYPQMNAAGHQVVAARLANWLRANDFLPN